MKKFILSIVTLIYLMSSSGIAMDVHFCMGEQDNISFYQTGSDKCSRCGMTEKKGGCCHNEPHFAKLSIDQSFTNVSYPDFSVIADCALPQYFSYDTSLQSIDLSAVSINDPPDISAPQLNILYSVFRI